MATKEKILEQTPWIEKYRPKTLDDIVLDENTICKIKKIIDEKDMPNIIITGMPGIGKTTTIKCIGRGIYGKYANEAIKELNASDDRGIKSVQETIMNFCKKKLDLNEGGKKEYAEHKIIILDEADNMTDKAQRLINTLMEKYHDTSRFAFTCNNSADIIEAIQSRCIILRYYRLNKDQIIKRLLQICEIEKIKYYDDAIEEIAILSQGDMRNAINNLQLTYNAFGKIKIKYVHEIIDKPQPLIIKRCLIACKNKNLLESIKVLRELRELGYSAMDILTSMKNTIKLDNISELTEKDKVEFLDAISESTYIVSQGMDTDLQLYGCISDIITKT